jgi:ribosomal-protein-alanine N-acetyltransferase
VHPQYLRQGIATKLLNQLLQDAKKKKTARILLEVRVSNIAACALYQKVGFEIDGRRKNYYPTNTVLREDALLMSLTC